MNAHIPTTAPAAAATEQPWAKVHRLSSELCAAMRENPDSHAVTMIYANPALTHPIINVEDCEYAELTRLLFVYRNAVHAERDAIGDLEALQHAREAAQGALHSAILEAR